jgi:hypothetical protein
MEHGMDVSSTVLTGKAAGVGQSRRAMAVALALVSISISLGSVLIWAAQGFPPLPMRFISTPLANGGVLVAQISYVVVGAILAAKIRNCPIGWLFLAMGLILTLPIPVSLLVADAHQGLRPAPASTVLVAWLVSSIGAPALVAALVTAGFLFPDGRLPSERARLAVHATSMAAAMLAVALAFHPAGPIWYRSLPTPITLPAAFEPLAELLRFLAAALLIGSVTVLVASLAGRYRRGDAIVRAQLRWFLFASAIAFLTLTPALAGIFVIDVSDSTGELLILGAAFGLATFPVAAAVAIRRYHLFGIDTVISRSLIYVPLMAVAGGLYTTSVVLFQRLFVAVTGETSDLVIVVTTLALAIGFTSARRALEGLVDRRWRPAAPAASSPDRTAVLPATDPTMLRVIELEACVARLERLVQGALIEQPDAASDMGPERHRNRDRGPGAGI